MLPGPSAAGALSGPGLEGFLGVARGLKGAPQSKIEQRVTAWSARWMAWGACCMPAKCFCLLKPHPRLPAAWYMCKLVPRHQASGHAP